MKKTYLIVGGLSITILLVATGCMQKNKHGDFKELIFSKFDENKDNKLTKKEYIDISTKRFDKMDINKDGQISKDEFKKIKPDFFKSK